MSVQLFCASGVVCLVQIAQEQPHGRRSPLRLSMQESRVDSRRNGMYQ